MRKISLIAIIAILLSMVCYAQNNKNNSCLILHPHEKLPKNIDETKYLKIFLAGTIDMGNSIDWQNDIFNYFKERNKQILFYNPRQEKWDATRKGEMDYQVNWELSHLEKSDLIIMYILGNSKSPISLLEFGLFAKSGKIIVACEKDFYRYDNVRITCKRYVIPLVNTLNDLKDILNKKIN